MTPEKLFHELLGLGLNWKVTECEFDRESGVVQLRIEETEHLWKVERSRDEGAEVVCYDHTEEIVWRHLNVFEHKCVSEHPKCTTNVRNRVGSKCTT